MEIGFDDYTKRQLTEPSRVKDARTESPAFGRSTLQMDPLMACQGESHRTR